ncbi:hypothetical protein QAD02_014178 [Eretmocerus hayati]|uniref:Uncharacterized protein n=1 Tax=Eretmocerus hayati TaxID=131215 RepID=A0ACC2P5S1_9HYME|nr:hypothetical protein QAD02_014178 [Eretmocerus hayati]
MDLKDLATNFTTGFHANLDLTRSDIQFMIDKISRFIGEVYNPFLLNKLNESFEGVVRKEVSEELQRTFDKYRRPFEHLRTESKRVKFTLDRNFRQAELWDEICRNFDEGKIVFLLFGGYCDGFQTGSPLGTHANGGSFETFYVQPAVLLPNIISRTDTIIVTDIFFMKTKEEYGNKAVFCHLIEDAEKLRREGVEINIKGKKVRVYFALCLVLVENVFEVGGEIVFRYQSLTPCNFRDEYAAHIVSPDEDSDNMIPYNNLASPMRDKSFLPDLLDKDEESNLTDQSSKRTNTEERSNIETPDEQGLPNIITPTQNPTCNQKKKIPYNITHDPDSSSSSDESFIPDAQSTKRWSKNLPKISKPDKSQTCWWDDEPMNRGNALLTFSDPNLHSSNSSLKKSTTSLPAYLGAEPVSNEIVEERIAHSFISPETTLTPEAMRTKMSPSRKTVARSTPLPLTVSRRSGLPSFWKTLSTIAQEGSDVEDDVSSYRISEAPLESQTMKKQASGAPERNRSGSSSISPRADHSPKHQPPPHRIEATQPPNEKRDFGSTIQSDLEDKLPTTLNVCTTRECLTFLKDNIVHFIPANLDLSSPNNKLLTDIGAIDYAKLKSQDPEIGEVLQPSNYRLTAWKLNVEPRHVIINKQLQ